MRTTLNRATASRLRLLLVLTITWAGSAGLPGGARAADDAERDRIEAELAEALAAGDDTRSLAWVEELLALPDLEPWRRRWAMRNRVVFLNRLGLVCEGERAAVAYLGSQMVRRDPEADDLAVRRAGQSMARACEALKLEARPPTPPREPEEAPERAHGTLTLSSGAFDLGESARRAHTSVEASMGLAVGTRLVLDVGLAGYVEAPLILVARPGLRVALFEPTPGGPVQLRLAGQFAFGGPLAAAHGVLAGIAVELPIDKGWGVLVAADLLVWTAQTQLAAEGRLGIFYAF